MKSLTLVLLASLFVISCSHSDNNSKPAAVTPAVAKGTGNPTGASTGFGSTNGKAGGTCTPEVIKDNATVMAACSNVDINNIQVCTDASSKFSSQHPNVDCTYVTADGGNGSIKTNNTSSTNSTSSNSNVDSKVSVSSGSGSGSGSDSSLDCEQRQNEMSFLIGGPRRC